MIRYQAIPDCKRVPDRILPTAYLHVLTGLQLGLSERDAARAHNLIEHETEIFSRPPKSWIQPSTKRPAGEHVCMLVGVCACVRACVRAYMYNVHACVYVCVGVHQRRLNTI